MDEILFASLIFRNINDEEYSRKEKKKKEQDREEYRNPYKIDGKYNSTFMCLVY